MTLEAGHALSAGLVLIAVAGFLLVGDGAGAEEMVTVEPEEIDDILVNPGRGWTTFHRFNEDHPAEEYPPTSIAYFRWYWDVLEPEEGQYNFAVMDSAIEQARLNGQKLAFRIMTCNGEPKAPQWYRELGAPGNEFNDGKSWQPDYSAPIYLEKQAALVEAFGERYDGHPGVDHVDIGSMGRWGEWHTYKTGVEPPPFEVQKRIVDMYLEAFEDTPLVMLIAQKEALAYAVEHGAGWRADCLGDMREGWCHMDFYPEQLAEAGVEDAWKDARVVFETCWTMQHWRDQGWDVDEIFSRALEMHPSAVNNKSSAVPEEWWPQVREFTKKMGYRLVLRRLEHAAQVVPGARLELAMAWENVGVAPCYDPYPLVIELLGDDGRSYRLPTDADVTRWLPGMHEVSASVRLPDDVPAGEYALRLALVDPDTAEPALKLAIAGREDDGWYDLSRVSVAE